MAPRPSYFLATTHIALGISGFLLCHNWPWILDNDYGAVQLLALPVLFFLSAIAIGVAVGIPFRQKILFGSLAALIAIFYAAYCVSIVISQLPRC